MAHKLLSEATAVGASNSLKVGERYSDHSVLAKFQHNGTTAVSALTVVLQGAATNDDGSTGLITSPAIVIGSTPEKIANIAFEFRLNGTNYTKGAVAAGTTLPTGFKVSDVGAGTYGVINVYINASGTISYGFPATTQAYTTAALAIAAGDAMVPVLKTGGSKLYIGRVLLFNNTGADWDSQTDDLTDGVDITTAIFMDANLEYIDMTTHTFSAGELTAQQALFHVTDAGMRHIRVRIKTLTGDGKVDIDYLPVGEI